MIPTQLYLSNVQLLNDESVEVAFFISPGVTTSGRREEMINLDYVNCLTLLCATPPSPIPGDIETLQTTKANGVTPLWPCIEQSQARKMVQQQSNSGLGLKAGQRGTQAVMDPH